MKMAMFLLEGSNKEERVYTPAIAWAFLVVHLATKPYHQSNQIPCRGSHNSFVLRIILIFKENWKFV